MNQCYIFKIYSHVQKIKFQICSYFTLLFAKGCLNMALKLFQISLQHDYLFLKKMREIDNEQVLSEFGGEKLLPNSSQNQSKRMCPTWRLFNRIFNESQDLESSQGPLSYLNINSRKRNSLDFRQKIHEERLNVHRIIDEGFQSFYRLINQMKHQILEQLIFQYESIQTTFDDYYYEEVLNKIKNKQIDSIFVQRLVKTYSFLKIKQDIENPQTLLRNSVLIGEKLKTIFTLLCNCLKQHKNSLLVSFKDHRLLQFDKQNQATQKIYHSEFQRCNEEETISKKKCSNYQTVDESHFLIDFSRELDEIFNKACDQKQEKKKKKEKPVNKIQQLKQLPIAIENERFYFKYCGRKYQKSEILKYISIQNNKIKEILIEGQNEFDEECLRALTSSMPNLEKINYICDFNGQRFLQLQRSLAFRQEKIQIRKCLLPSTQYILNLYGNFSNLNELHLDLGQFDPDIKIINEKIKHLTLNSNAGRPQPFLPHYIFDFINKIQLESLSLLEIKSIKCTQLQQILGKKKSLKRLSISGCRFYGRFSEMFSPFQKTNLQTLFLKLCEIEELNLPETLKILMINNCHIPKIEGLSRCIHLQELSISNEVYRKTEVSDQLIRQIPNPQSLTYLNLTYCSVTDNLVPFISHMCNLKALSLSYTQINLTQLFRYHDKKSFITRLGIEGMQLNSKENQKYPNQLESLATNFTNVEVLCLTFRKGLRKGIFTDYFPHLKKIHFAFPHGQKNCDFAPQRKPMRSLIKSLQKQGIQAKGETGRFKIQ